jgi:drug/metabolite transporter (DMT)-like permease
LVLLLATTAILGKLISLPAEVLVGWRTLLAAAGAAAWVALARRRSLWPGKKSALSLLLIGAVVGLHWICFFGAIRLAGISVCLAGLATLSLFTAFTEPFIEKRRVRPFEVLLGLLVVAGILLIAGSVGRENLPGLGVALAGALLAAIFPVLNRRLVTGGSDPMTMVAWEMAGAFAVTVAALPLLGGSGAWFAWQGLDWLWLLLLAWVCTVFAHGFHIHLLRHMSAYTMNLAFNFEPLYGILAAALFFAEHQLLDPLFYSGLGAILAANLLHPFFLRKLAKGP